MQAGGGWAGRCNHRRNPGRRRLTAGVPSWASASPAPQKTTLPLPPASLCPTPTWRTVPWLCRDHPSPPRPLCGLPKQSSAPCLPTNTATPHLQSISSLRLNRVSISTDHIRNDLVSFKQEGGGEEKAAESLLCGP